MTYIRHNPNTFEKLQILSQDSQYDLACACSYKKEPRRKRSEENKWIYPVVLPNRRKTFLLKTLVSNVCANDCRYCPLRANMDYTKRVSLSSDEIVKSFFDYYYKKRVQGVFLTNGVQGNPDESMKTIIQAADKIRKDGFRGYIHLKILPGASDAAIEEAIKLSSAVSINIETAGENNFKNLSSKKDYLKDIIHPLKLISQLTGRGNKYPRVHQTTQFVVGASKETDQEIIKYTWNLYKRLNLNRVYFSAYQRGLGDKKLPGENNTRTNDQILNREHRLYQTDFLLRQYGFNLEDIPLGDDFNLNLDFDPKEAWARSHPEIFPININKASYFDLLKIPGIGPVTARRIESIRKEGQLVHRLKDVGLGEKRKKKSEKYIKF